MSAFCVPLDFVDAPAPLVGMTADALDSLYRSAPVRSLEGNQGQEMMRARSAGRQLVFRQCLIEAEGTGYWEFQRPSDDVLISWTKVVYARDTWINIPGPSAAFKIRLLLKGELSHPKSQFHMRGPASSLSVYPARTDNGYIVRGGMETELVVIHCRPSLLTRYLGDGAEELPGPFKVLNRLEGEPFSQIMYAIPNLQGAIHELFQSRLRYSPEIQPLYLNAKIQEILCNVMQCFANQDVGLEKRVGLQAPALRKVREAQRILLEELASPPRIGTLARRVGVSQTKLKADFKAATGETIYTFVKRSRMEKAVQLLLEGTNTLSEIAYAVGYEYAANFTSAFKEHCGVSPRRWLQLRDARS